VTLSPATDALCLHFPITPTPLLTSVKCSGAPAPLLAMTGMVTALLTASTRLRSKPWGVTREEG
jgi:hypothetical protein